MSELSNLALRLSDISPEHRCTRSLATPILKLHLEFQSGSKAAAVKLAAFEGGI